MAGKYTPIKLETVSYPLTGGVDTKVHALTLPPPKLQVVENAYVDQTGSVQRRFGRAALTSLNQSAGTVTEWVATATCQSRLLGFTNSKLYDYSEADSRWSDRGRANSYRIRARQVDAPAPQAPATGAAMDMAVLGSYRLYAYDYYPGSTAVNPITAFTLVDSDGNVLAGRQTLQTASAANTSFVKVVAHGTRFYIVYRDTVTVANLKCFIIDTTSAATIATSLAGAATNVATNLNGVFDVASHITNGPFVCYCDTTVAPGRLTLGFISTAGALTDSTTSVTADVAVMVSVATIGSAAVYGIAYSVSGATDVYAQLKEFTTGTWSTLATSAAIASGLADDVRQIQCCWDNSAKLRIYFTAAIGTYPCVRQATFTTGSVLEAAPTTPTLVHSQMAARPFLNPDQEPCYWVFGGEEGDTAQPTLYLMKYDGTLLGWANQGVAILPSYDLNAAIQHVASSNNTYSFLCAHFASISTFQAEGAVLVGSQSSIAMREVIVDFAHDQSHVTVEDGRCVHLPGGMLQQYDGIGCTEAGFLRFVDTARVTLAATAGSGSLTIGADYSYMIVPEWTNAQGEREQGTNNGSKTITNITDDTVLVTVDSIPWTLKKSPRTNLSFAVYRTLADPTADSPFYRVGVFENEPDEESPAAFEDTMSDAIAATQEQFRYTAELDHIAPPAGHIVTAGNGRVFVAGFADQPNTVLYSKTRSNGEALAFNDALTIQVPASKGPIAALAVHNESLIIYCERAIYRVNGPGLGNGGTTGGFTDPVLIASDTSAIGPRSVVTGPMGVMFDSPTGKHLLDHSFGVKYIGAPLEKLTDPGTCTGATVVPELHQVRFSYAATTDVYDYYHGQWYVFTHASDGPTCVWNGVHAAIAGDEIVYDSASAWTDAGDTYAVTVTLGWMRGSSTLLTDLRVRRVGVVGQSLAAHNLSVMIAYDQETVVSQAIDTVFTEAGSLAEVWRLRKQLCSQIEITIRDAFINVYDADVVEPTAGFRLNEVVFEIGLRGTHVSRGG